MSLILQNSEAPGASGVEAGPCRGRLASPALPAAEPAKLIAFYEEWIEWYLITDEGVKSRGLARDCADLRGIQIRAGIVTVAIEASDMNAEAEVDAAIDSWPSEWRQITHKERQLICEYLATLTR